MLSSEFCILKESAFSKHQGFHELPIMSIGILRVPVGLAKLKSSLLALYLVADFSSLDSKILDCRDLKKDQFHLLFANFVMNKAALGLFHLERRAHESHLIV